jgi:hypothetical protein
MSATPNPRLHRAIHPRKPKRQRPIWAKRPAPTDTEALREQLSAARTDDYRTT